jgi:flagellar assembly factor FliW
MISYCTEIRPKKMKPQPISSKPQGHTAYCIDLPLGLIGFPELKKLKITAHKEEAPFLHLKEAEKEEIEFIALEPYGIFKDYKVQILDPDLEYLNIKSADEVYILNIVSIQDATLGQGATVNLVGPIIINRTSLIGKQIVIGNYKDYSSNHPLFS